MKSRTMTAVLLLAVTFILPYMAMAQNLDSKAGDEAALQDFYVAMDGPNWDNNTGWSSSGMNLNETIFGVVTHQVNGETRVKELNLSGYPVGRIDGRVQSGAPIGNNLSGTKYPDSFANLKQMTHLRLKGNNIRSGVMWLADFAGSRLEWVSLNGSTGYGGQDEIVMSDLTRYNHGSKTWSSYNKHTGFLPDDLSGLTNLRMLELMSTALVGPLPTYLPSSLQGLFLSNSGMSGDVSKTQYSNLSNVTHFYISNRDEGNRGEGIIGSISQVSGDLYDVTFSSGSLPSRSAGAGEWWIVVGKTSAEVYSVSGSTFRIEILNSQVPSVGDEFIINEGTEGLENHYGELPADWDNMSEMRWFYADGNNFSGDIPDWSSWYDLRYFGLSNNGSMVTSFPEWLVKDSNKHTRLHTLNIGTLGMHGGTAGLQGPIPQEAGNGGVGGSVFNFGGNSVSGSLPPWTPEPIQLDVADNDLEGSFPDQSTNSRLRWIKAENNAFTGSLPAVEPTHSNFQQLRFQNNQFSGDIPESYGQISDGSFSNLLLQNNLLDGNIPLGIFGNGWTVRLDNNKYTPKNLVPILGQNLSGVTYLPQKAFGKSTTIGTGCVIDRSSFDYAGNSYRWYRNGSVINGETSPAIDTGIYGEGTYVLEITHPDINYTFESEPVEVVAGAGCEELPDTPDTPVLASPSDGATEVSTSPTLDWDAASGADTYRVQVAAVSDFSSTVTDQSGITNTSLGVSGLSASAGYYWRVQASNSAGTGNWSPANGFTTASSTSQSTPAPVQGSPSDGATGTSLTPTFSWQAVDGADSYILHVSGRNPSEMVIETTVTGTSFTPETALDASRTHDWRVRAVVDGTEGEWSPIWAFTTGSGDGNTTNPPPAPALTAPADRAMGISTSPTLDWETASGADSYRVQVATNLDFSNTVIDQTGITLSQHQVNGLANSTSYYWRVQAANSAGSGSWSGVRNFTTVESDDVMETSMDQNYPNPFNPSTQIRFTLGETQKVSLKVYDTVGRQVAVIVEGTLTAGSYERTFRADNLASGVYFLRFVTESRILTSQMTLMK